MAPDRRIMALAGGLLAAVALSACAPQGSQYANSNYSNASGQQAGAGGDDVTAEPAPSESATADPADTGDDAAANNKARVRLTTKLAGTKVARMGAVVTDQDGWVLYRFDKDTAKPAKSNCSGKCAEVWPPALTEDGAPDIEGVDGNLVGTVDRGDGTQQLTLNGWPLYRYIGDKKPGQWKGQAVGNTWWVIAPTGKKNLTCVPKNPPKAVAPPSDADESGDAAGSDSGSDSGY